jgi:hypothetical protein
MASDSTSFWQLEQTWAPPQTMADATLPQALSKGEKVSPIFRTVESCDTSVHSCLRSFHPIIFGSFLRLLVSCKLGAAFGIS